ncbi:MAG: alanine--tRNA ligase [Chthoniobacterales bacterium]|nr:alanine--tRNA ligase [Chthoniobacterales bacterium]
MTSAEIRQSFLDFFREKQHTVVPSSSLLPGSPNLLFTNAGMNQFVPIFLGEQSAIWTPPRTVDTQKCIRAGGKHNDLDDVGLDTYHHTFFEMLGNWSFGDYFKKEAIEWAWELVVERWKLPPQRLYATVYRPGPNEPSESDQEAHDHWACLFTKAGLDPAVQIVNGNKNDNFWMMGDTGPCGPCSELHIDLTPNGDTNGSLVNTGDPRCIEIWNLVFIQFNANADGTFTPLPQRHVDTGMGFERVTALIQGTKHFTDFSSLTSNYETDVFRPIFDEIEKLSGKRYGLTLPKKTGSMGEREEEKIDVAFRVIADHIRTLSFAIADGIQPSNEGRGYVLRRILRRAVRYGRTLGFHEPFFFQLVDVVIRSMGDVFPELPTKRGFVQATLRREEEAFNRTLDRGIAKFEERVAIKESIDPRGTLMSVALGSEDPLKVAIEGSEITGAFAFQLYDTYGFPLDLTELMARERGISVDTAGFERLMEEQRARARSAQKKTTIQLAQTDAGAATRFLGYDLDHTGADVQEVRTANGRAAVILNNSVCYPEMGGQVGDAGEILQNANRWRIAETRKSGNTWVHLIDGNDAPAVGDHVTVQYEAPRRRAIERHHSVTHLLHWALHEVVSRDAAQKGSYVGPEKLTFDFNSAALTAEQLRDVEKLVNERIVENAHVSWTEMPYAEVKARPEIMQFFGDKYGDTVRVVQIGGQPSALDGYSMELCGGTHVRGTGEIGLFRIVGEAAIAAGVRRVEAVAGLNAYGLAKHDQEFIRSLAAKLNSPINDLEKRIESMLAQQKALEKTMKSLEHKQAAETARQLIAKAQTTGDTPAIIENLGAASGDQLQAIADALKQQQFGGVVVLAGAVDGTVALAASVGSEFVSKMQAGKIIQAIAPIVGGKGGGRPDSARGAGKDASKIDAALEQARALLA